MPGVAEVERRTKLAREQKERKSDRVALLRLVKEGRLHEADERQLETIKLALELSDLLDRRAKVGATVSTDELTQAVKDAIQEGFANVPAQSSSLTRSLASDRPQMRHVSLTEVKHGNEDLDVQGDVSGEEKIAEAGSKLKQLRELKGKK